MISNTHYQLLNGNDPQGRCIFEEHFKTLADISKDMARELDKDWRQGFVDAVQGELRLTDSTSHKIMYMGAFMNWLSANMPEFDRD